MKKLFVLIAVIAISAAALAQGGQQNFGSSGSVTISGTPNVQVVNSSVTGTPVAITSNQCDSITTNGVASVGFNILGTYTGNVVIQVTKDGTNWVAATYHQVDTPANPTNAALSAAATGNFEAYVANNNAFRVCGSTVATGTATVVINYTTAGPNWLLAFLAGVDSSNGIHTLTYDTSGDPQLVKTVAVTDGSGNANQSEFVGQGGNGGPLPVYQFDFNGNNGSWDRHFRCGKTAFISALGAATTQIVALVAGKTIRVCSINFGNTNATATNIKFVEGTGTNCGTGQTQTTGNFIVAASANLNFVPVEEGAIQTNTTGDALCATGSAAGAVDVTITYDQH